ncbi:MAG: PqqD family peptide modification chaperone [Lachnospiraceae bacterium]|nr:PqqD family peptide modification chaperone [Lachnospiraceae bacterium]
MNATDKIIYNNKFKTIDLKEKGYVIIDPESHIWLKTSETGKDILERLKVECTYQELLEYIKEIYEVNGKEIEEILDATICDFYEYGVVAVNGEIRNKVASYYRNEDSNLQQVWLNITNRCNLRCPQCFAETRNKKHNELSYGYIQKFFEETKELELHEIIISGGEPCLHSEFLRILQLIKSKGIRIKILTNGSISDMDSEKVDVIFKLVDNIQVSLDGVTETTHDKFRGQGSFSKVLKCLEKLKGFKGNKGIAYTPLPENICEIESLYDFALAYELDYIHLNRPSRPSQSDIYSDSEYFLSEVFFEDILQQVNLLRRKEAQKRDTYRSMQVKLPTINATFIPYNNLIDNVKKVRCAAGITTISIMEDGSVYPCVSLSTNRKRDFLCGNIKEQNSLEIIKSTRNKMLEMFHVERNKKCKKCSYKYFCGGGCRAEVDLVGCDRMCNIFKERYKEFFEHLSLSKVRALYSYRKEKIESDT